MNPTPSHHHSHPAQPAHSGISRRAVFQASAAALASSQLAGPATAQTTPGAAPMPLPVAADGPPIQMRIKLQVKGKTYPLNIDGRTSVLDALREHIDLKGVKKGCDHG